MANLFKKIENHIEYKKYQKEYRKNLISSMIRTSVEDLDSGKIIETELASRDKLYTELLKNHVELTKHRNILKEIHKWLFFWLIMALSTFVCIFLIVSINNLINNITPDFNSEMVALITALLSLVSTLIAVPVVVTKYLFNNNEDDNITAIISKTQEHDNIEMKMFEHRFHKKQNIETEDKRSETEDNNEESDNQESELLRLLHQFNNQSDSDIST